RRRRSRGPWVALTRRRVARAPSAPDPGARTVPPSLPVRDPDVLHAHCAPQELAAFALLGVVPVALAAVVHPRGLEVPRRLALDHRAALGRTEVPQGLDAVVARQHLGQLVAYAG